VWLSELRKFLIDLRSSGDRLSLRNSPEWIPLGIPKTLGFSCRRSASRSKSSAFPVKLSQSFLN
jgi:hypothetical protein